MSISPGAIWLMQGNPIGAANSSPMHKNYSVKILFGIVGIVSAVWFAVFLWTVKTKSDATLHLSNGVEVTPIEVKPDVAEDLLDARVWKFEITKPDAKNIYNYELELYRHNRFIQKLGGLGLGPANNRDNQVQLTVGILPLGNDLFRSRQIREIIRGDGGGASGTFDNPFANGASMSYFPSFSRQDNLVYLIGGNDAKNPYHGGSTDPKDNDFYIALHITKFSP